MSEQVVEEKKTDVPDRVYPAADLVVTRVRWGKETPAEFAARCREFVRGAGMGSSTPVVTHNESNVYVTDTYPALYAHHHLRLSAGCNGPSNLVLLKATGYVGQFMVLSDAVLGNMFAETPPEPTRAKPIPHKAVLFREYPFAGDRWYDMVKELVTAFGADVVIQENRPTIKVGPGNYQTVTNGSWVVKPFPTSYPQVISADAYAAAFNA